MSRSEENKKTPPAAGGVWAMGSKEALCSADVCVFLGVVNDPEPEQKQQIVG